MYLAGLSEMARPLGVNRSEVLKLREKGLTIGEIAQRLGCSETNVAYHLYPKERESMARKRKTKKYRDWNREYYMNHIIQIQSIALRYNANSQVVAA
jgi:orotate phosphoribosyltransferase-like protein